MNSNNNKSNKKTNPFFKMDIKDEIYDDDPFDSNIDSIFGFKNHRHFMNNMFKNMFTDFGLLSPKRKEQEPEETKPKDVTKEEPKVEEVKEEEKPKEVVAPMEQEEEDEINTCSKKEDKKEEEKKEEVKKEEVKKEEVKNEEVKEDKKEEEKEEKPENKNNTFYSKVFYRSSYNNMNKEPQEESYQSQTIRQYTKDGHKISETKENYKNSDGVIKSAFQRNLDDKTARFIKEKNLKTGKNNQKKIAKGIEENELKDFNKTFNEFSRKCGFRKNWQRQPRLNVLNDFDNFDTFGFNPFFYPKQISDGNDNILLHKLLF